MVAEKETIALVRNGVFLLRHKGIAPNHRRKRRYESRLGLRSGRLFWSGRRRRSGRLCAVHGRGRGAGLAAGGAFRAKVLHHALVLRPFALVFFFHQGFLHPGVAAMRRADNRIRALFAAVARVCAIRASAVFALVALAAAATGEQRAEFFALDFPAILLHFLRAANQLAGALRAAAFPPAASALGARAAIRRPASRRGSRLLGDRPARERAEAASVRDRPIILMFMFSCCRCRRVLPRPPDRL